VPARIRIQTDRISADLAAGLLHEEGIPAEVVADSDAGLAYGGAPPLLFSLVVPSQHEERARRILEEVPRRGRSGRGDTR
jgi:putative signal transducing protein